MDEVLSWVRAVSQNVAQRGTPSSVLCASSSEQCSRNPLSPISFNAMQSLPHMHGPECWSLVVLCRCVRRDFFCISNEPPARARRISLRCQKRASLRCVLWLCVHQGLEGSLCGTGSLFFFELQVFVCVIEHETSCMHTLLFNFWIRRDVGWSSRRAMIIR